MICGTRSGRRTLLWDRTLFSPSGPTATNGIATPFRDVLPVIHTPTYYDKRFFK